MNNRPIRIKTHRISKLIKQTIKVIHRLKLKIHKTKPIMKIKLKQTTLKVRLIKLIKINKNNKLTKHPWIYLNKSFKQNQIFHLVQINIKIAFNNLGMISITVGDQ